MNSRKIEFSTTSSENLIEHIPLITAKLPPTLNVISKQRRHFLGLHQAPHHVLHLTLRINFRLYCNKSFAADPLMGLRLWAKRLIVVLMLSPLDREGIKASVSKTHRAIIVEEAEAPVGVGSEVMAIINEECFWELDAPPARVSAVNTPIPYAANLEDLVIPDEKDVIAKVLEVLGRG